MTNIVEITVKAKDETKTMLSGIKGGFEQAFAGIGKLAKVAGADLVSSLIGPAGVAAAGLAAEFAGAGAALGAFGAAVKPQVSAISDLVSASDAYDKAVQKSGASSTAAKSALQLYNEQLKSMPPATAETATAFLNLRETFKKWSDSLAGTTMPIFTRGINVLTGIIPKLTPLVKVGASALSDFMGSIEKGAKGGGVDAFIKEMTRIAADTLPHLLNSLKNIGVGIGGLVMAFLPFTSGNMSRSIETLTARFAAWGQSMRSSQAFKDFIENSQGKLPGVITMLGNLLKTLMAVAAALAPFTGVTLLVAESLAKLVAAIPQGVMDWLAPTIGTIVLAIKAWSVVQGVLNIVLAANPIGIVVLALAGLVGALILAYKKSETFRTIVNGVWESISDAVDTAWNGVIKKALHEMQDFFKGDLKKSIDDIAKSFDGLGQKAFEAGQKILGIKTSFDGTKDGGNGVIKWARKNWEPIIGGLLAGPVGLAAGMIAKDWGKITQSFSKGGSWIASNWRKLWNGLVDVAEKELNVVSSIVLLGIRNVGTFLLRPFPALNAMWQRAWARLASVVASTNDRIVNIIRQLPGRISRVGSTAFNGIVAGARWAYNQVVNILSGLIGWVSNIGSWIRNKIGSALGGLPGFAHGGIVGAAGGGPRSGLIMVGEQGRELIQVAPGSKVIPHGQTESMMSQGGGGVQKIQLEWVGGNAGDGFIEWLRNGIRIRGGDTQAVLGS